MGILNRWYRLLNYLVSNDQVSLSNIQQNLNVSQQTVKSTINLLNNELSGIAQIIEHNGYYYIEIYKYNEFENILNGSLKQMSDYNSSSKRQAYIIRQLVEAKDYILIQDLADDLSVSRGTVNNDLRSLRQISLKYDVIVNSAPNKGLKLEGSEFGIRLLEIYHSADYFHYKVITDEEVQLIYRLQEKYRFRRRDAYLLLKVLDISLFRVFHGDDMSIIENYINYSRKESYLDELITGIEYNFRISLSEEEIDFISFPLNLNANNLKINQNDLKDNIKFMSTFEKIVSELNSTYFLDFNFDELFDEIANHLIFLINRLIFKHSSDDIFHGEIEKKYPMSFQLAKHTLNILKDAYNSETTLLEADYLALYFELVSKTNEEMADRKEIAIICNTGKGTAAMVRRQIERVIGQDIKISQFSEANYETEDLSKYFAIITTIPLESISNDIPMIYLSNIFNDKYLSSEWNKIISNRDDFTDDFEVVLHEVKRTQYEELILDMILDLESEGLVDLTFRDRILAKDESRTLITDNGIALPHEINYEDNKIIINIAKLTNHISIKDKIIDLVILLAIPNQMKENDNALLNLYDLIFGVAQNNNLKDNIMKAKSINEMIKIFNEGEVK
ncbi:hypothetical protein CL176_02365 [Suicoccus acidiformans]|uniref:Uncharacterized protein n=1 Tax=Suicoccus acidiformans TaxID=2036206 RepID=A0A347WIQ4_9LACT|nr:HTH domain-containing protein [Suicoccus acidiformans]AXY24961.1 hypothetical protein CL176_02365 [Suicoccus acidiformans]